MSNNEIKGSVSFNFDTVIPTETMVIYCRVSTTRQGEEGNSLEVQEQRGIELSNKLGLTPIIFKEVGSGNPLGDKSYLTTDERPVFKKIMSNVKMGNVKNLWVDKDDRLTRDKMDLSLISHDFKEYKVSYYIGRSKSPKDLSDWTTDLIDNIIVRVKQQYVQDLVERSNQSKRKRFQEGCWMKGPPPFGYDLKDKMLVVNKKESKWVKNFFEWYNNGISVYKIVNRLFKEQVPSPRGGGRWKSETIFKILRNDIYIGLDTYGDLVGTSPTIIDKKLFNSVQTKYKRMRTESRIINTEFLLRGLLKCPSGETCGCLGKKKNRKFELYSCIHRQRKYKNREDVVTCNFSKSIRRNLLDDFIWDTLCNTLFNSHQFKEDMKQKLLGNKSSYTTRTFNNKIKSLSKKLLQLKEMELEIHKEKVTLKIDEKTYKVLSQSIQEEMDKVMVEINKNQMKVDTLKQRGKWINWVEEHNKRINQIRGTEDFEGRLKIIQHYLHEITILDYDNETKQHSFSIDFKLPLFEDKFEWLRKKDGSFKRDKFGKRKFKITEGVHVMETSKTLQNLLNGYGVSIGGFYKPYLTISFKVISHKFNVTQYVHRKYTERKPIHKRINELMEEGLGYRKIHKILEDENWEVGTSPTCVDTMIKKMKRRKFILSQPTITEYDKMEIQVF